MTRWQRCPAELRVQGRGRHPARVRAARRGAADREGGQLAQSPRAGLAVRGLAPLARACFSRRNTPGALRRAGQRSLRLGAYRASASSGSSRTWPRCSMRRRSSGRRWSAFHRAASVAVAYAARNPERVSALVLIGACARGWRAKNKPRLTRAFEAMMVLMRQGWGGRNAAFRQIFTTALLPGREPGPGRRVQRASASSPPRRTTPQNSSPRSATSTSATSWLG